MSDYDDAYDEGLIRKNRWDEGIPHHPMSIRLMKFIEEHDFEDYSDYFGWNTGGDGDNGESLMFQMDPFFELLDLISKQSPSN